MRPARADRSIDQGPFTIHRLRGERVTIVEAPRRYRQAGTSTIVSADEEYGTGSNRDRATVRGGDFWREERGDDPVPRTARSSMEVSRHVRQRCPKYLRQVTSARQSRVD